MSALDYLKDYKAIRMEVPLKEGPALVLECVVRAPDAPYLEAVFLAGQLPADQLDADGRIRIRFEAIGRPHVLNARIDKVVDADHLRLVVIEALSIEQQREYFRIDVDLSLSFGYWPEPGQEPELLDYKGVVNLSGGGLWLPTVAPFEIGDTLMLQMTLPTAPPHRLRAKAQVVRRLGPGTGGPGAGLKFIEIEDEDREQVIGFCFAEQRLRLRTKVRV